MAPDEKRENPFLRTIQSLEEKYGALEAQGLDSGMEIDFISGKVHVTNVASKRAVQTVYRNLKRLNQVFGLSKRSAPCNSLEVYGREFRKREKQCRQLDKEFETKFKSNYPEWKPCGPSTRNKIRSTVRETVKEFVFERPSDYINYIKRGTGSSFDIFHRKDIILPPMVLGDCSRSRECSPSPRSSPRNSLSDMETHASANPMVAHKDCSRSRECSPDRTSRAMVNSLGGHVEEIPFSIYGHSPSMDTNQHTDISDSHDRRDCVKLHEAVCYSSTRSQDKCPSSVAHAVNSDLVLNATTQKIEKKSQPTGVCRKETFSSPGHPLTCNLPSLIPMSTVLRTDEDNTQKALTLPNNCSDPSSPIVSSTASQDVSSIPTSPASCRLSRSVLCPRSNTAVSSTARSNRFSVASVADEPSHCQQQGTAQNAKQRLPKRSASGKHNTFTFTTPPKTVRKCVSQHLKNTGNRKKTTQEDCSVRTSGKDAVGPKVAPRKWVSSSSTAKRIEMAGTLSAPAAVSRRRAQPFITEPERRQLVSQQNSRNQFTFSTSENSFITSQTAHSLEPGSAPVSSEIAIGKSSLRSFAKHSRESSPAKAITNFNFFLTQPRVKKTSMSRSMENVESKISSESVANSTPSHDASYCLMKSYKNYQLRRKSPSNTRTQSLTPPTELPSKTASSDLRKKPLRLRNEDCSSTLATTSSKTIGRRCSGNDSFEPTSLPIVAPNGLWNESVAAIFKSYEDGFLAVRNKTNKMTILGFDAREFRKQCRDPSQTALSGFVNCAGEYRESPGENYLDNGMKEDRRAMAAAKSRNRVLRDGYFA
ncbi:hypothetical protein V3C99_003287 [Haemonchus contortus]